MIVNNALVLNLNYEYRSRDGDPFGSCRRRFGRLAFDRGDNVVASLSVVMDYFHRL